MAELSDPSAHLSIRVQSGPHYRLSKIFFAPINISFAGLFLCVSEQDSRVSEQHVLERVISISYIPGARDVSGLKREARGREAPEGRVL